jgi:DNA-binding transcriptional MocR family regulator
MDTLRASDTREILRVAQQRGMISFAGGLPAPSTFPVAELTAIAQEVLETEGARALQYSTTEGHPVLREQIASRLRTRQGVIVSPEEVLITAGSQQGLDLIVKAFLEPGDEILCESPTYLAFIQAAQVFQPTFVEVPTDDEGMRIEALEARLAGCRRPRLIYVVVRFEGEPQPSLKSLDPDVIQVGTFSKIFCPGLRLAWIAAPAEILQRFVILKQAADLHTATLNQMFLSAYLARYDIEANIARIRALYRRRRDAMVAALERTLPPGSRFTRPQGGLFIWVELPEGIDARQLLARCLEQQVAFVPGECFFPTGGHANTLRLNFSHATEERIEEGIARLGRALKECLPTSVETRECTAARVV